MFRLLLLAGVAIGGFLAFKRMTKSDEDEWDDWDDETMYGSAQLHQNADAQAPATV